MQELWKPVVGHEQSYEVSNLGRVRSLARIAGGNNPHGRSVPARTLVPLVAGRYLAVTFCKDGTHYRDSIHRVVANAFVPNPLDLPYVNHISGDRTDNSDTNLEWCSPKENTRHALDTGLFVINLGEKHGHSKLTEIDVIEIRRLHATGMTPTAIARLYPVCRPTIRDVVRRVTWTHI